ncbi:MAG: SprB repeat-containing protein, partial [Bacteroidales bacterium]|nr:SprB repeat-containing protein [Bacteroidales bacterium]
MKKPLHKILTGILFLLLVAGVNAQTVNFSHSDVTCYGGSDGSITMEVDGGSSQYMYHIYKTFQTTVSDSFGPTTNLIHTFSGLDADWYTVYVVDFVTDNIIGFNTLQVTQPNQLTGTVSSTNIVCFGADNGTISVTNPQGGHGNYEYRITGYGWQSSGSFTGLAPGTYVVEIRDADFPSCIRIIDASRTITELPEMTATVSSTNITCFNANNGTITISSPSGGSGSYQYTINGGSSWQATTNYTNLTPATYDVWMRDATHTSCVVVLQDDLILSQPAALSGGTISVEKPLTCYESYDGIIRANPTGGTAPYTYTWYFDDPIPPTNYVNTGVTTRDYTVAGRGGYYVRVNDANNCGPTNSTTLQLIEYVNPNVPLPLVVSATSTPACNGESNGSVTISGSGGWTPYNYYIVNATSDTTGPQVTDLFGSLPAGTYEPWITDDKGCTKKGTDITVAVTTPPTADAGSDGQTCVNTAYAVSGASATNYSSILWTIISGNGSLTNANTLTPTYTPDATDAGTTVTLRLTANGNAPCASTSDDMDIDVIAAPTANAGGDGQTCENAAYTVSGA